MEQAVPPVHRNPRRQLKAAFSTKILARLGPGTLQARGNCRVRSLFHVFLFAALTAFSIPAQTDTQPWFATIARLAAALSRNDSVSAMETFDSKAHDYGAIESDIEALVAQADVLCAIDPVEDKPSGDAHEIDTDWYLQLKSQADAGPTERRRERVRMQLKQVRGQWRITMLSPLTILAPIRIQ